MILKYNSLIVFILAILSGCAALGTKTIYESEEKPVLKSIGFTTMEAGTAVLKLEPGTDSVFKKVFIETFRDKASLEVIRFEEHIKYSNPDTKKIKELCTNNNLDGFVLTRVNFTRVKYFIQFLPIGKGWDTETEMKLFDKNGKVILIVSHDTSRGNSYLFPPSAIRTTKDATKGVIKRFMKELGL